MMHSFLFTLLAIVACLLVGPQMYVSAAPTPAPARLPTPADFLHEEYIPGNPDSYVDYNQVRRRLGKAAYTGGLVYGFFGGYDRVNRTVTGERLAKLAEKHPITANVADLGVMVASMTAAGLGSQYIARKAVDLAQ